MLPLILGILVGFVGFFLGSHPTHQRSLKAVLPRIRIGFIELCPNMKINIRRYQMHIHHWLNLIVLYFVIDVASHGQLDSNAFFQGIFVGGTLQGLTYPDRFQIFTKKF